MARILVHVEGLTERVFVREALRQHLIPFGHFCDARLLGGARLVSRRGGIRSWAAVQRDVIRHLREDPTAYATTMVDYYAMPAGDNGWPGRQSPANSTLDRARSVRMGMEESIMGEMGPSFDLRRFIPFVVMHEFEGLLFSDCARLASSLNRKDLIEPLEKIRGQFESPEDIDDSAQTAPSKRIVNLMPNYQKVLHGNEAMLEIGLEAVRKACPIFDRWITTLEAIPVS